MASPVASHSSAAITILSNAKYSGGMSCTLCSLSSFYRSRDVVRETHTTAKKNGKFENVPY